MCWPMYTGRIPAKVQCTLNLQQQQGDRDKLVHMYTCKVQPFYCTIIHVRHAAMLMQLVQLFGTKLCWGSCCCRKRTRCSLHTQSPFVMVTLGQFCVSRTILDIVLLTISLAACRGMYATGTCSSLKYCVKHARIFTCCATRHVLLRSIHQRHGLNAI